MTDETLNQTVETAAPATEAPAEQSADDIFSAAFSQFASPGEKPAETAPAPEAEAQQTPPVDAEEGEGAAPEGEQTTANVDASQSTAAATSAAPTTEPPRYTPEEWMRIMAAQQQAQQQYAQQPSQPPAAPERSEPRPVLSKEEIETVQEFRKEWPDVAKAIDIQQKAYTNDLLEYVFNQFAQVMQPALQQIESVADRTHVMDIYDFVPDYDQVREPVIGWVSQLPQSAFRQYAVNVVQNGEPGDIRQLVDQWRMFTGAAPAAQATQNYGQQTSAPRVQHKAANPAVARAAAAMAPVRSQRTAVVQTEDPNDFDGAFERAAAEAARARELANVRH